MFDQPYIRSRWFEDIPVGEFHVFGSHTFSEKEIIDFGKKYSPEIYHTDPEGAFNTPYHGLVASGWHITAIWMKLMVSYMERFASGVRDGRRNGAGIGLQDLVWQRPVRPGHTVTFTYEITSGKSTHNKNHEQLEKICADAANEALLKLADGQG